MLQTITLMIAFLCAAAGLSESITVSAAISLREPLLVIAKNYEAATGNKVDLNFGASGQLAFQIQQGAPVDAFISAAEGQVTQLQKAGLLAQMPQRIVARNQLVLIIPAGDSTVDSFPALASPTVQRIAVGQPKTVPAGEYATQVLQHLNIAAAVKDRLIFGANVRQVLDYVFRGEVDAGIVYSSDARAAGTKVKVVATARPDWHQAVVYPAVIIRSGNKQDAAARFLDYLLTTRAQTTFVEHGFIPADTRSDK